MICVALIVGGLMLICAGYGIGHRIGHARGHTNAMAVSNLSIQYMRQANADLRRSIR